MADGVPGDRAGRARRWLAIATLIVATSVATVFALEFTMSSAFGWSAEAHFQRVPPTALALNTGLIAVIVLGLFGLTGRLRRAIPLAAMVATMLVVVNNLKIRYRGEPLYPSDFAYAGEAELLVASVGTAPVFGLLAAVLGVGVVTWIAVVGLGRLLGIPPAPRRDRPARALASRGLATVLAAATLVACSGFSAQGSTLRRAFDGAGTEWVTWSQNENYMRNGFVAGFLFNMPAPLMSEPEGYGRDAIVALVEEYSARAMEINEFRDAEVFDETNVVIVLGESFIDPLSLDGLVLAEDPLPFTRDLVEETMSGTMRSVAFGGGTANVEFEVLTGMSTASFGPTQPPYQGVVAHADTFPSVLWRFAADHTSVGIHPFVADFYRRSDVYRAFGFDRATFHDTMTHTYTAASENGYISDAAAFEELVDNLRDHDEPVFATVITMQNHAGYAGLYPDPIPALEPASATESWGLSDYLRGLFHADAAIETLLDDLAALDEDTVVLYFGDHAPPGVIPDEVWDAQEGDSARYETPWFVWSTDGVHPTEHQGLLSPTQLWNQVLRAMDAPVTPWDALLLTLEANPDDEDLLDDYLLLQFDASVGARHGTEAMFTVP